jgi:hypothetical protein
VPIKELPLKALRFVFTRENIELFSSKSKVQVWERLVSLKTNNDACDKQSLGDGAIPVASKGTPKQMANSYFRFGNALSDPKQPTTADLTAGRVVNQSLWETLLTVFNNEGSISNDDDDDDCNILDDDPLGQLIYTHDQFEGYDPSNLFLLCPGNKVSCCLLFVVCCLLFVVWSCHRSKALNLLLTLSFSFPLQIASAV